MADKFTDDDFSHWRVEPPGGPDPKARAPADATDDDKAAQAAAKTPGGERKPRVEKA